MTLPSSLNEAVKRGEAMLFLGAGASVGALHPDGREMPVGNDLRDLICDRFLNATSKNRALDEAASLAANAAGQGELDQFVANSVRNFNPTEAHKLLPHFRWKGIFGTNYDLLVEAGYGETNSPLQPLIPFYRDTGIEKELNARVDPVPYFKLHGSIDHLHDKDAPLILTQESYLSYEHNRKRLFNRLGDWATEYPIIFIGTRIADPHIRQILDGVEKQGGSRPTYYFVSPDITEFDEALLASRRMTPIKGTFNEFMSELDSNIAPEARIIHAAIPTASHSIERHFRRNVKCPESVAAFLNSNVEHVYQGLPSKPLTAALFFKGESSSWHPIENSYDIERSIYTNVMVHLVDIDVKNAGPHIVCIKGVAGSGKSVFGRRIAYDLARNHAKLVLYCPPGANLRADPLLDLHDLTGISPILIVDQAADQIRAVSEIISRLSNSGVSATFVMLDTNASFGSSLESVSRFLRGEFNLRNLNEREIDAIISKLELHKVLGQLEGQSGEERKRTFETLADRQLLVALYEATQGKPLEELIVDEYHRIALNEAQELYLLVCTLNRFGVPIRAGLIQRVMGIRFTDFEKRFLTPLSDIVFAEFDPRSRDYAYRARHSQIAEIVFRRILDTQSKQSEQYIRIIEGSNISYTSDSIAMRKMLSARNLKELTGSLEERRRILAAADRATDGDAFILQQQAIVEMNSHRGDLEYAAERLERAIEKQPRDVSLKHSQATLYARKAKQLNDPIEKRSLRGRAKKLLSDIKSAGGSDAYFFAVKAGLAIDDLEDRLAAIAITDDTAEQAVIRLVEDAERALNDGLALAPDFQALSREAFRLRRVLGEKEKGISLLKRTLEKQPHLEFVAATYARAIAKKSPSEAMAAIKACIAEKPHSKLLNQALFELLLQQGDDFRDELLSPLRKAFTSEGTNIAMHVHAIRLHFMRGESAEYREAVSAAGKCKVHWTELQKPRFKVQSDSDDGRFSGTIATVSAAHAYVEISGLIEQIYVNPDQIDSEVWDKLRHGQQVTCELFFNARGPIAREIALKA